MRDEWTESDVDRLAAEEADTFDRKSGLLFQSDQGKLLDGLAKAISAFANSGGGALILGVEDDGSYSGIPANVGQATIKDWLEQKIPNLVQYPLSLFRVHTVVANNPSRIPEGRRVVVVEVGDSPLAPHQSARDHKYYHRAAGRSEPARHFYIELLRQRTTNPALELSVEKLEEIYIGEHGGQIFLEMDLRCVVTNVGRVAAYKWSLGVMEYDHPTKDGHLGTSFFLNFAQFPVRRSRPAGVRMDDTILPGRALREDAHFAFLLGPVGSTEDQLRAAIDVEIGQLQIGLAVATETSPGEVQKVRLAGLFDPDKLVAFVQSRGMR